MKSVLSKVLSVGAIAALAVLVASCGDFKKSSVVGPPTTAGKVDFSRYVSIGNSLVAGYESGALYESAQEYSYPNLIAQQAGLAMGTTVVFNQPLISDPGFGIIGNTPVGHLEIVDLSKTPPTIEPTSSASPVPTNAATVLQPYNNLGVPGAILSDMTDTTSLSNPNPFFGIVLRRAALGKSCVQQALNLHPTFVTVEVGDNDVLGYATSGGIVPYTSVNKFATEFTDLMDSLLADAPGAKFAVANIPDVTAIPFFTTVPDSFASPVTGKYVGAFIVQRHDANGNLYAGVINAKTDYILLTAIDSLNAKVGVPAAAGGTGRPLPDQFVLDSLEVATAEGVVNGYNQVISDFAASHSDRVALVDIHGLLNTVAQHAYVTDGLSFTAAFIQGGLFGLDGIHPTAQGYAIIANTFIRSINSAFGSSIPVVAVSTIPGSIILAGPANRAQALPNIHYQALGPVLQLFDRYYSH